MRENELKKRFNKKRRMNADFIMLILQHVTRSSRKSLRVLGSVGEPINPSAWRFLIYPLTFVFLYFILLILVLMFLGWV